MPTILCGVKSLFLNADTAVRVGGFVSDHNRHWQPNARWLLDFNVRYFFY